MRENNINQDIGAIGCELLDINKQPTVSWGNFPSLKSEFTYFSKKILEKFWVDKKQNLFVNNKSFEVDYIIGADLFIPNDVLQKIGYFDPSFFMYYEETDLQKRMANSSYKRIIIEGPKIIHIEGASRSLKSKLSYNRFVLNINSFFLYINKHFNGIDKFIYKFVAFFIRLTLVFDKRYSLSEKISGVKLIFKLTFGLKI
ncbi:MAG: hypothetical protein QM751_06920 [Paludibacteraceae bacterium]